MKNKKIMQQSGFSLIELMIVVVIIGTLAALANQGYRYSMMRGNESAAQQFMMAIASKQEQYILDARIYTDTLTDLGLTEPSDVSKAYTLNFTYSTSTTPWSYNITATPKAGTIQAGKPTLTLNSAGQNNW